MDEAIAAHQGAVYRLALSQTRSAADAQDVMQDVFIKLMRSQVPFRDCDHLRAWLLRVTINQCRDLARQAWHRRVEVVEEPDLGAPVTQDEAVELLMEHPVWRAMDALKESDALCCIFDSLRSFQSQRSPKHFRARRLRCACGYGGHGRGSGR